MIELPRTWRWSTVAAEGALDLGRQRHPDWHTGPEMRPYLRVANVFEDRIDSTDLKYMDFSGVFDRYKLRPGDVLLNEGQSPELLGRPAIYRGTPTDIAFTNTLIRFRAGSAVIPEWALIVFRHYMHSGRFTREARITTNIGHLSATRLKSVEFPVPPLEEQREIVTLLDDHLSHVETGVIALNAAARRIRALERSALDEHFSRAPSELSLDSLVASIEAGRSFGGPNTPAGEDEWGVIKVSAMTWGEFRPDENKAVSTDKVDRRFEIHEGDLLLSRANTSDYVGASVLVGPVRKKLLLSDKSLRISLRPGVRPEWLWRALQAPTARRQISSLATGTKDSMRNISQASLRRVRLPEVSLAEQARALGEFARTKSASDRLRREVLDHAKRGVALRRSLLALAFSGHLNRGRDELSSADLSKA